MISARLQALQYHRGLQEAMTGMASPSSEQPNTPPSSLPASHDPAVTGYDPNTPYLNVFNILTNRMTSTGKDLYREDAYIRNEARDIKRVTAWRDYLLQYSPIVRFMSDGITSLNGRLDADNILCKRCPTRIEHVPSPDGAFDPITNAPLTVERRVRQGGGFSPDHGILICANEMRSQGHMEDTLAHEMVHAWDHLRFKVDWNDLRHAACSEIRASTLSGECRWTREFFTRGNWTLTQQFQRCVRERAVRSLMNRPNCENKHHAEEVVDRVWDSCFKDTRPFDEVYK
jgi:inner membrane protease ATP23